MSVYARDVVAFRGDAGIAERVDDDTSWSSRWKASRLPREVWDRVLLAPMRDILSRPGKSFRANLVSASWALVDERRKPPPALAEALEILHAGSLIVDDIEDDSDERRGAPCIHQIHGVPRALNAGNHMYFWALELLSTLDVPAAVTTGLARQANRTMLDCHRGQALDLGLVVGEVAQEHLPFAAAEISALKTGALMSLASYAGVLAAGGTREHVAAAESFGMRLGVVLQKLDDLGNLTSRNAPGKRFEDLRAGKVTWPWAWASESLSGSSFSELVERSTRIRNRHREIRGRADGATAHRGLDKNDRLDNNEAEVASLADDLLMVSGLRRRAEIQSELDATLADLRATFGDCAAVKVIGDEMNRLKASYV